MQNKLRTMMFERIRSFWKNYTYMNYLKNNGGVDPCSALRARLVEAEAQRDELKKALVDLLSVTPETKNDFSGVGYCFGCGVIKWYSGQERAEPTPCKKGCPLTVAREALVNLEGK